MGQGDSPGVASPSCRIGNSSWQEEKSGAGKGVFITN